MLYSADNIRPLSKAPGRFPSQHALRPDTLHLPFSLIHVNASLHKQVFLTAETKSGGPFPNETCNKQNLTVQTVF